jgi:hypothetical protein
VTNSLPSASTPQWTSHPFHQGRVTRTAHALKRIILDTRLGWQNMLCRPSLVHSNVPLSRETLDVI